MTVSQTVRWQLPAELLAALAALAAADGSTIEAAAAQVLQHGLQEIGVAPHGRCSLRTGLCSEGPKPLPLQQP